MTDHRFYIMKDGTHIEVLQTYPDLLSNNEYLLVKMQNQKFVVKASEFALNLLPNNKRTKQQKINLYRSYFRGRESVIATSFEVKKEKKRVYYPLCLKRKKIGCPKLKNTRVQCAMCTGPQFQPLTDNIIYQHLKGEDEKGQEAFYGIYPITEENKVYFLALDFDKEDWKETLPIFINQLEGLKLKPLIEVSQSGNGCHVWFFFSEALDAKLARKLGDGLLKLTMLENPTFTFESYDRMFPNQDSVPTGGFGNLIALPLQGGKYKQGCSRFIDKEIQLVDDVWETLESTPKLSQHQVYTLLNQINQALPTRYYYQSKAEENMELSLFIDDEVSDISSEKELKIVESNELFIKQSDLSKEEVLKLKFLATFPNKAFFVAQRKRMSTKNVPRMISLFELSNGIVCLPRGLKSQVQEMFPKAIIDRRMSENERLEVNFKGELYLNQEEALSNLMQQNMGILCAGTGFGKTVVAAKIIAEKKVRTLILVHNKTLAVQWKNQLEQFLEINQEPFAEYTDKGNKKKKSKIGKIYGGTVSRSGLVDVGLFQTLKRQKNLTELLDQYDMIIVDEAHHIAATTFEEIIRQAKCRYIYGLTATPKREDGLENILYMRLGEIAHVAKKEIPNHIDQKLYMRFTSVGEHVAVVKENSLHENNEMIVASMERNEQIIQDIFLNLQEHRHIIVLSRFVKHLNILKEALLKTSQEFPVYILNGKMKNKELKQELTNLRKEGKPYVLFTTGNYAGEGFDLATLDTLILAMPISGKGVIQQYLGRLLRKLDEKEELRVYDYVDYAIPMMFKMYQKRLNAYKKLGYKIVDEQSSKLYRSNMFVDNYRELLIKDIVNAQFRSWIILPYLNKKLIKILQEIPFVVAVEKIIFLPYPESYTPKFQQEYRKNIELLKKLGYHISLRKNISQAFVIVDDNLLWTLSNDSKSNAEKISLRLYSSEIVKRIRNYYSE